ncbi:MAG: hypothetical protein J2P20_04975 [Pseudonocardia sp.]|nr:hypothetical protein [Pseudonocardia sp.]MBO0873993.1 hypothetical protein [Pseudonocardia sp.]
MTADHGSDSGRQRTVAELLQQYGGDSPSGGGRRRRRAAEPEEAPQPRADEGPPAYPPATEGRGEPATRLGDLGGTSALDSTWASLESPASRTLNPDTSGFDARNGSGSFSAPALDAPGGDAAPGSPWDRPPHGASNAPSADPFTSSSPYSGTGIYQAQPYPPGIYQSDPVTSSGPVRGPEEATDQLPRYRGRAGAAGSTQLTGPFAGGPKPPDAPAKRAVDDSGPSTAVASRAALFDDEEYDEEDADADDLDDDDTEGKAGGGWAARWAARKKARAADKGRVAEAAETEAVGAVGPDGDGEHDTDTPAGLDDDVDVDVEPSGFRVWAVLIAQGVLGAVGGAGLWVGFSYLWRNLPVVALVAAVVATGGLVLMVRTIRGSDDLRTTMLAVLVGLVVTISPVALMIATWAR